jgi:hypothetical protein
MRVYHYQTENTTSATIQRVRSIEGCEATTLPNPKLWDASGQSPPSGLVRAVLPKSGVSHATMTLLPVMLFRFNLSGRLAALTLMNIGILGGLSIDNYSLCW